MRTMSASQLVAFLVVGTLAMASAQNVTLELLKYPQYSTFTRLMVETGVVFEVQSRSSLTILLPENSVLDPYVAEHPEYTTQTVADVLRYHVLLQYFGGDELAKLSADGYVVTTLFQTTGRANDLEGFVNLTKTADGTVTVGPSTPMTPPQADILTNVSQYPYNYSFIQISAPIEPLGLVMAPTGAPVPSPEFSPEMAPEMSPEMAPEMAPMEGPYNPPVMSPAPPVDGPSAEGPGVEAATSGAFTVGLNAGAAVVSLVLASLWF